LQKEPDVFETEDLLDESQKENVDHVNAAKTLKPIT
jgi:hypothetical protein